MDKNFIRVYKWDEEEEIYKVAKLPIRDSNYLSIQYNIIDNKIYSSNDETEPIELDFSVDNNMSSVIIDKTKCVREGIIEPFMYVEYGLTRLFVKTFIAFAVIKCDRYYKLMYKLPIRDKTTKKFKEARTFNKLDGTYSIKMFDKTEEIKDNNSKFLYIPDIQIPLFEHNLEKLVQSYKISQTIEDVIKENPDSDPEQLKIEFGNFIIDELKEFVSKVIMNEIEKIKHKVGTNHYNNIYRIADFYLSTVNVKLIKYADYAHRKCQFKVDKKTHEIKFVEYEYKPKIKENLQ